MTKNSAAHSLKFDEFLTWFEKYCTGSEKSQAQTFLTKLLQAFGNSGIDEVGAMFEAKNLDQKTEKQRFADFVWPGRIVIEMKERGRDLRKDYQQILDYWVNIVPKAKYAALSNFDQIWIYDFNKQMDDPIHIFDTKNLLDDYLSLAFLFPNEQEARFKNNLVAVTEEAAEKMGQFYSKLVKRKILPQKAQRFVLQLVVAMFSEDVGLIPKATLFNILDDACKNPKDRTFSNKLKELFTAMATKKISDKPKPFSQIRYFNGGIFSEYETVELNFGEVVDLYKISEMNWSKIRPSIFGAIFQATVDSTERHRHGIHYTSENDIMKIVLPTIVRPFQLKIDGARTIADKKKQREALKKILSELQNFKVLDPACGSGNFLYLAFINLRRLEFTLRDLLGIEKATLTDSSTISLKNFYGIDTNLFGLELAKVALSLGRKISNDEFDYHEDVLPFENLDENFLNQDALYITWPTANAIIGNPPFLGGKYLREELGNDYVDNLYKNYPDIRGQPDYCVYWFRFAQDSKAMNVGLVATNSIAQGQSREAALKYIIEKGGYIVDAVSTQEWSGDANVHVAIVNWTKHVEKMFFQPKLDALEVRFINSSLKPENDFTNAHKLIQNQKLSFEACQLAGKGFVISEKQAKSWIAVDKRNSEVLKPMLDGRTLVDPNIPLDWVIDFNDFDIEKASTYLDPFSHVKTFVKPERDKNNELSRRQFWWRFGRPRPEMRDVLKGKQRYFCLSKVSKYTNFRSINATVLPCEANMVIASDDFYILGVLNSKLHRDWVKAQCSTLKGDTRYTNTTCFETFSFLWDLQESNKEPIRQIMKRLEDFRNQTMKEHGIGITKLYNAFFNEPTSQLYKLHRELDRAVCEIYNFKYDPEQNYNEQLFHLNQKIWEQEQNSTSQKRVL